MDAYKVTNLFWSIVWAVVLAGCILGLFWKVAIYMVALIAAVMLGCFLHDYIYTKRIK